MLTKALFNHSRLLSRKIQQLDENGAQIWHKYGCQEVVLSQAEIHALFCRLPIYYRCFGQLFTNTLSWVNLKILVCSRQTRKSKIWNLKYTAHGCAQRRLLRPLVPARSPSPRNPFTYLVFVNNPRFEVFMWKLSWNHENLSNTSMKHGLLKKMPSICFLTITFKITSFAKYFT